MSGPAPAAGAPALVRRVPLAGGAEGLLVIDRLVGGRSFGGIRILPDLDEGELRASARTMSLKYGFAGLAIGGAKAALRLPAGVDDPGRDAALRGLGRELADALRDEAWIPGADMGTSVDDVRCLFEGAGVARDLSTWLDRSHEYTAWGVLAAARAALAAAGRPLAGTRFVLQGYGRVGSALARLLADEGGVAVAVSTRDGAIARPSGLPLDEIDARRAREQDRWLRSWPAAERIDPATLLTLPCDLALPCARAWAITEGDVPRVRAAAVVCAANAATTPEVERALAALRVVLVPDFVANVGGVVGSVLERYAGPRAIRSVIERGVLGRVTALLDEARARGATIRDVVEPRVEAWLDAAASGGGWPSSFSRGVLQRLPLRVKQPLVMAWARRRLFP